MQRTSGRHRRSGRLRGAVISPLLANIYLHFCFDLWAQRWRRRHARGRVLYVRYADDIVAGFEHKEDAQRFLAELRVRLEKFALTLHPEKTRLIEFGRFAAASRARRGLRKPRRSAFWASFISVGAHVPGTSSSSGRHVRRDARETESPQGGAAATNARADPGAGSMAGASGARIFRVLRGADQRGESDGVPVTT